MIGVVGGHGDSLLRHVVLSVRPLQGWYEEVGAPSESVGFRLPLCSPVGGKMWQKPTPLEEDQLLKWAMCNPVNDPIFDLL